MKPDVNSPASAVHRILFQALLEIREQGHEQKNKLVFHLADLFHNVVLEMETAARGEQSYDEVLHKLTEKAGEKGLDRWLSTTLSDLEKQEGELQPVG